MNIIILSILIAIAIVAVSARYINNKVQAIENKESLDRPDLIEEEGFNDR